MGEPTPSFRVLSTHSGAEEAIRSLERAGFDVKHLSIIGKGYNREEKPMDFYTSGDRIQACGGSGGCC